jgi:hypothetical protein
MISLCVMPHCFLGTVWRVVRRRPRQGGLSVKIAFQCDGKLYPREALKLIVGKYRALAPWSDVTIVAGNR